MQVKSDRVYHSTAELEGDSSFTALYNHPAVGAGDGASPVSQAAPLNFPDDPHPLPGG